MFFRSSNKKIKKKILKKIQKISVFLSYSTNLKIVDLCGLGHEQENDEKDDKLHIN